jgi:hypothetical protein
MANEANDQAVAEAPKMSAFSKFMMKDSTFILLVMGAAAAIFAGTFMYLKFHAGAFNEVSIVAMLQGGIDTGDFTAAAGFAAGFLIARILEGPLVGLMDIGGFAHDWCWHRPSWPLPFYGVGASVLELLYCPDHRCAYRCCDWCRSHFDS